MKIIRRLKKEPIFHGCYVDKCPFLPNQYQYRISYRHPRRTKCIGLTACYMDETPILRWARVKKAAEDKKLLKKEVMESSFAKLLFSREYNGRFERHIKITTFFNNGEGKIEARNYFF